MEWLIAGGIALTFLLLSVVFLFTKLMRFAKPAKTLALQLEKLAEANAKAPEIAKAVSVLGEDPALHLAKRQQFLREARARKRARERRLRDRDF
jgi:biopolymer transport protein ExbB/TolQ